jgi:phage terminase large subunit-like protein
MDLAAIPAHLKQPHPVLPLPSRPQVLACLARGAAGVQELQGFLERRAEKIALEKSDPLRHGYRPETFLKARELLKTHDELFLSGQNRGGKTRCAAEIAVGDLVENPNKHWLFFDTSEKTSQDKQQKAIFQMLPPEWRKLALGNGRAKQAGGVYLNYAPATGFTNFKFVLPNGSMGSFGNYKQDVTIYEGYEIDGVWFDENAPLAFIEAMAYRVGRGRRMLLLFTFTPVAGGAPVFTASVQRFFSGATIMETKRAELLAADQIHVKGCPRGHMPYVMQCRNPKAAVLFFHFGSNPFGANDEVKEKVKDAPAPVVKVRAYGWVDKFVQSAFPKFRRGVHTLTRERFDEIARGGGTRYVSSDPRPSRNWFLKWYFVTPQGWTIVYREWPDLPRYGEWALPPRDEPTSSGGLRVDYRPGPAQSAEAGRGPASYKSLILEIEGWSYDAARKLWVASEKTEKIERRVMDPRFGGSAVPSQDEGDTIIAMMAEEGRKSVDNQGRETPAMHWEQAPASAVHGAGSAIEMIGGKMDYDEHQPISVLNCPSWYAVEDCAHSILAYEEFTNAGSEKDALKDPVDADRYFVKSECSYVSASSMKMKRPVGRIL